MKKTASMFGRLSFLAVLGCSTMALSCSHVTDSGNVGKPFAGGTPTTMKASVIVVDAGARHFHFSVENHGGRSVLINDNIQLDWVAKSEANPGIAPDVDSGQWDDLDTSAQAHYVILRPVPESRRDTNYRIFGDQFSFDLPLDDVQRRVKFSSGHVDILMTIHIGSDLYPKRMFVDLILDLPLRAGSMASTDFTVPASVVK